MSINRQEIAEHGPGLISVLQSGLDKCNRLAVVSFLVLTRALSVQFVICAYVCSCGLGAYGRAGVCENRYGKHPASIISYVHQDVEGRDVIP